MSNDFTTIDLGGGEKLVLVPKENGEGFEHRLIKDENYVDKHSKLKKKTNNNIVDKNIHAGHRKRLRDKYIRSGIDSLDHPEALEVLIGYSIPRRETNSVAHRLINEFGSLKNVFRADFDELVKVDGVGEMTAALIMLCEDIMDISRETNFDEIMLLSQDAVDEFCCNLFKYSTTEKFAILFLDSARRLLSYEIVSRGTVNSTEASIKKVIKFVMKHQPSAVILAHNHPAGNLEPSSEDVSITNRINDALKNIDVELIDHIVTNGRRSISMEGRQMIDREKKQRWYFFEIKEIKYRWPENI